MEERKRVAHEIHDGIGQSLSVATFKIENILQKAIKDGAEIGPQLCEAILPILKENVAEARRIQMGLRPSILDDLGILPTLEWFCREFQKTYSINCIESTIEIREEEIHPLLKTTIFRIIQEALNNAAKHSNTDRVHITLRKNGDQIELVIRDNGQGFDLEGKKATSWNASLS